MPAYIISPVGVDLTIVDTKNEYGLGARATDNNGGEFVYCSFAAVTVAKDVVSITEAFAAESVTTALLAGEQGQPAGVCQAAQTAASYGWARIYGPETGVNVGTGCLPNVVPNTTATAGRIDDDQTANSYDLIGLVLTTAEAANKAPCVLNYPRFAEAVN